MTDHFTLPNNESGRQTASELVESLVACGLYSLEIEGRNLGGKTFPAEVITVHATRKARPNRKERGCL